MSVCVEAGGGRRRRRRSRPGIQNQKQEPHTKMWEKCILLSKMFRCSRFWHSSCHFCFQHLCCRVWAILFVCVGHCEVIESDRRPRKTIDSVWFSMIQLVHPLDDLAKNHTELVCFWSLLKRHQRISKKPYWTYLLNTLHGQLRLQSHRPPHAWCMCELDQVMRKSETRLRWIFRCRKSRSFANFYFHRKVSMGTTPHTHTEARG